MEKNNEKHSLVIIYSAIMDEYQKNEFFDSVCNGLPIDLGDKIIGLNLVVRPKVLYIPSTKDKIAPTTNFHNLYEFWQIDKSYTIKKIETIVEKHNSIKAQLNYITELFEKVQQECGVNLLIKGDKLGNIEYYESTEFGDFFDIKNAATKIILQKKRKIEENLIVNCETIMQGRTTSNVIKEFLSNISVLEFDAEEIITDCIIKVWNLDGHLVYSCNISYCLAAEMNFQISGPEKTIKSPWTERLRNSSSNYHVSIEKLEKVKTVSASNKIKLKNNFPLWYNSFIDGRQFSSIYNTGITRGAFVPKTSDKFSEIDSFSKIREYINCSGLEKVVIADPFFSVVSIEKLLPRVSYQELDLVIITSLSEINPDTNANTDYLTECKKFIECNSNVFHTKTQIINVRHGDKQAFHDRYLIRYFKNGQIDGFMLSNSLNAAGQYYPFVVVPFEKEICYCVAEYLQNLIGENSKFQVELLYEPTQKTILNKSKYCYFPCFICKTANENDAIQQSKLYGYIQSDASLQNYSINELSWPIIIKKIFDDWDKFPCEALVALGDALYNSCNGEQSVLEYINKIPNAIELFVNTVLEQAPKMESKQRHDKKPYTSYEFRYWSILSGAEVSYEPVCELDNRIFYYDNNYWCSLYRLLLMFDYEKYMALMYLSKSPLMMSLLIEKTEIEIFDENLYMLMINSSCRWIRELGSNWLLKNCDKVPVLDIINKQLNELNKLEQFVYMLSSLAFIIRTTRKDTVAFSIHKKLYKDIINSVICLLNDNMTENKVVYEILSRLHDCEKISKNNMIFSIASSTHNILIRNYLFDMIISGYKNIVESSNTLLFNESTDEEYLELIVQSFIERYKDGVCCEISKILHWRELNDYVQPYLKEYNFSRWNQANIKVSWDIAILKIYMKNNILAGKLKYFYEKSTEKY